MKVIFEKYQGNGNDFVIIDDRKNIFDTSKKIIEKLCDRRYGIGADGLMLIRESKKSDFEMLYFNSDGLLGTMCGNGGRCIAAFAFKNGISKRNMIFNAVDGLHEAVINKEIIPGKSFFVSLRMTDVKNIKERNSYYFLDTGSPHHVVFVENVNDIDVYEQGKKIRYSEMYKPGGTNVNFVEITGDTIFVRTYERGVENETLSCGTGVTASAIATYLKTGNKPELIKTKGGDFEVDFKVDNYTFTDILLKGPAEMVFKGEIEI